jgi:hypothetical protein
MQDATEHFIERLSSALASRAERPYLVIGLCFLFLLGLTLGLCYRGIWSATLALLVMSAFAFGIAFAVLTIAASRISPRDTLARLEFELERRLPDKINSLLVPWTQMVQSPGAQVAKGNKVSDAAAKRLEEASQRLSAVIRDFDTVISAGMGLCSAADVYRQSVAKAVTEQSRRLGETAKKIEGGADSALLALKDARVAWEQNGPVLSKALEKSFAEGTVMKGLQQRIDRTMVAAILETTNQLGKMNDDTIFSRILSLQEFVHFSQEVVSSAQQVRFEIDESMGTLRKALNDVQTAAQNFASLTKIQSDLRKPE